MPRSIYAAITACVLVGVAGCSTGDLSSTQEATSGDCAAAGVVAAKESLETFIGEPAFNLPAGAVPFDARALQGQGKRILAIPIGSQFDLAKSFLKAWETQFTKYGVRMDTYANQGTPTEWSAGVQQAIRQDYDGILLLGNNPRTFTPAIQEANAAGIPVFDVSSQVKRNGPAPDVKIAGYTYPGVEQQATLQANWITADSCGRADVLIVTSKDILNNPPHTQAMRNALQANCPECNVDEVNVPVTEWAQKMQGAVQSALIANPNIKYIASCCDAMTSQIAPAISAAGKSGVVKFVGASGTPAALDALRKGSDLTMTVGEDVQCFAAAAADNVMRSLLGKPTLENVDDKGWAVQAQRIFTKDNAAEAGVPAEFSKGYGGACSAAYTKIWSGA